MLGGKSPAACLTVSQTKNRRGSVMAAYLIIDIIVHDKAKFEEYTTGVFPLIAAAGGKLIAFDESPSEVEGSWKESVIIVAIARSLITIANAILKTG
jgi:uncharacterized protein (DUF1330 family)